MYGEHVLNPHHVLRYGYTKEFLMMYRFLRYKGIEIPTTLIRPYHVLIRGHVNRRRTNRTFVRNFKIRHRLYRMEDVQKVLNRKPKRVRNLSAYPHRKAILIRARMVDLALAQFRSSPVILMVHGADDLAALKGKKLPSNFKIYHYAKGLKAVRISKTMKERVLKVVNKISRRASRHHFLSRPSFQRWLYTNALKSIRTIEAMENLIRRHPIGVVIDNVEIINPGATLSLVAHKYGIPFVMIPQLLMTDRSVVPAKASHYFVWGRNYRRWLHQRGVPNARIKIVGHTKYESLLKEKTRTRRWVVQRWRIPAGHRIVVIATQPLPAGTNAQLVRWIRVLTRLCERAKLKYTFLIKPHQHDKFRYDSLKKLRNVRLLSPQENFSNLVRNTDLLATISSNTAIEAALFHKSLLVLQPNIRYHYEHHNNRFNSFLAKSGAGIVITKPTHWYQALRKFEQSHKYRTAIIRKGQKFLARTVQTSKSSNVQIRRLIRNLLNG